MSENQREPDLLKVSEKGGEPLNKEEHDDNLTAIEQAFRLLCSDLDQLSSLLAEASLSASTGVSNAQSGSNAASSQVLALSVVVDGLQVQLNELRGSCTPKSVCEISDELDALTITVSSMTSDVSTALSNSSTALDQSNQALAASNNTALEARVDDIENLAIPDLQTQIDNLTLTVNGLVTQMAALAASVAGSSGPTAPTLAVPCMKDYVSIPPQIIEEQLGAGIQEQLVTPSLPIPLGGLIPLDAVAVEVLGVVECAADTTDVNDCYIEVGIWNATKYRLVRAVAKDEGVAISHNSAIVQISLLSGSPAIDWTVYVEKDSAPQALVPQSTAKLYVTGYFTKS